MDARPAAALPDAEYLPPHGLSRAARPAARNCVETSRAPVIMATDLAGSPVSGLQVQLCGVGAPRLILLD